MSGLSDRDRVDHFENRRATLEQWLRTEALRGAAGLELSRFRAAESGFSNATLFTTLLWSDETGTHSEALVLKCQPPGHRLFPDHDLRLQYDVMRALHTAGVPVPLVRWFVDDETVLGGPAYFMDRVPGRVASGFRPGFHGHGLFYEADVPQRRSMWFAAVDAMVAVHQLDVRTLGVSSALGPVPTDAEALARLLATIESQLDSVSVDTPVLREALAHLKTTMPPDAETALCWGDPRPGNIVYRDGAVAAVLDWELAHYGPPEGDLAYFLLVDEVVAELNDVPRLEGLPQSDETIAHYEAGLGREVANLDYHFVLQALRMAAMLVLTVKLSPPELVFPPNYLEDNVPIRRLTAMLRTAE